MLSWGQAERPKCAKYHHCQKHCQKIRSVFITYLPIDIFSELLGHQIQAERKCKSFDSVREDTRLSFKHFHIFQCFQFPNILRRWKFAKRNINEQENLKAQQLRKGLRITNLSYLNNFKTCCELQQCASSQSPFSLHFLIS